MATKQELEQKLAETQERLKAAEERAKEITSILSSVDGLKEEIFELTGNYYFSSGDYDKRRKIGRLKKEADDLALLIILEDKPEITAQSGFYHRSEYRTFVVEIGKEFAKTVDSNLVQRYFRLSDGKEKGSRSDNKYCHTIDLEQLKNLTSSPP